MHESMSRCDEVACLSRTLSHSLSLTHSLSLSLCLSLSLSLSLSLFFLSAQSRSRATCWNGDEFAPAAVLPGLLFGAPAGASPRAEVGGRPFRGFVQKSLRPRVFSSRLHVIRRKDRTRAHFPYKNTYKALISGSLPMASQMGKHASGGKTSL